MPNSQEIEIRENDWVTGAKRVSLFPNTSQRIVDSSTAGTVYVGASAPGKATSDNSWLLEKIVTSGTTITITHATDSWDNRATATYA